MKHLWEIEHPYYCNEGNYYSNDCADSYESFEDFLAEYADADFDMNLVFRFDWEEEKDHSLDDNYRDGRLQIFWMGQRKGLYRSSTIKVCHNDEPKVIAFLKPRWEHLKTLWAPFE